MILFAFKCRKLLFHTLLMTKLWSSLSHRLQAARQLLPEDATAATSSAKDASLDGMQGPLAVHSTPCIF